jgi:hypothetical protein
MNVDWFFSSATSSHGTTTSVATSARTTYHDAGTSVPTSTRTNDATNESPVDRDDNGRNPDLAPDLRGHTTGEARSVSDEVIPRSGENLLLP